MFVLVERVGDSDVEWKGKPRFILGICQKCSMINSKYLNQSAVIVNRVNLEMLFIIV